MWSVVLGAVGLFDRVVPDADRLVLAQAVQHLLGPRWPSGSAGIPGPTTVSAPRAAGVGAYGPWAPSVTIPPSAPRRPPGSLRSDSHPPPPATSQSAVLDIVAAGGGADEYETFLARYRKPANPQEENRYLYALASFTDPELAARTFGLALSEVRTQNAPFLIQLLLANRVTGAGDVAAPPRRVGDDRRPVPLQHRPPHARRCPGPVLPPEPGRAR